MIEPRELLASVGFPEPRALTRMNGQDAAVWRVDDGERSVALRVLPPGRGIEGEVRAQKIALDLGMPVPTVLESGVFAQHPFTITTWLAGESIGDALAAGGEPAALGSLLGRALAGLHEPLPDGGVLCHLDFQPFNVLVTGDEVTGIVDWSNARIGDPREDLATTRVVLQFAPALMPEFEALVAPFADAVLGAYGRVRRLPHDDELRPFAQAAARTQLDVWAGRVESDAADPSLAGAAKAVLDFWS
ncbi:hypothetical protein GCM10022286_19680 [Gryllotalpicola daejeonensis]|uniref:Aminoglycoside phosphotransferase domain-containing protein n=1 Tax=Gryllotalpicola daejeonensis TaxID=993087 RepID=A0ABP7ZKL0_9MICO